MSRHKYRKLQKLLESWPPGTVMTTKWLSHLKISRQLLSKYKSAGWIKAFGPGAFSKPKEQVQWYGGLYTLQSQLRLQVHVGGKTALEFEGLAHNIPIGRATVDLLVSPRTVIPKWFTDYQWEERLRIAETNALSSGIELADTSVGNFTIRISSRERAALELLILTPRIYSFEETRVLMGSLSSLRGDVLTELLANCSSEKAKRLLLYFGDQYRHPWRSQIKDTKIKIGNYLLKIASNKGKYQSKYNLFLPSEYVVQGNNNEVKF